ncbi:MAG: methicillin resistance protein [Bacteroidetes bacterium]|nr:MAG: methicillin resistance protein [Bacteroidota bacterium]
MNNKEKYIEFCKNTENLPIFFKDWWLDATCGKDNWDIILVEKKEKIIGVFPVFYKKINIFKGLANPILTPRLGVWLNYPENQKYTSKLGFEKKVINEIISKLPKHNFFAIHFHYNLKNWLPFYWNGFSQTTKYSYVIDDLSDLDKVFSNFKSNIRNKIKKAEKIIKVEKSEDLQSFYNVNELTYKRQNKQIPYSFDQIRKIDNACKKNNSRAIFLAKDNKNIVYAGLYLIFDKNYAYQLMLGVNPKYSNTGVASLLIWEAIKFSATKVKHYDFEGSIIENIETFFRSFGGKQTQYFKIMKYNSLILKVLKAFK